MERWVGEEVGRRRCSADEAMGVVSMEGCRQGNSEWGEGIKTQRRQKDRRRQRRRGRGGWQHRRAREQGWRWPNQEEKWSFCGFLGGGKGAFSTYGWKGQAKGEARESPARASMAKGGLGDAQQEKQFSFTCFRGSRADRTGSWLGTGSGRRPRAGAEAALPQPPWDAHSQHTPSPWGWLSHWVPALQSWMKGQLTEPCSSQLSGLRGHIQSLGLSNPVSPCFHLHKA